MKNKLNYELMKPAEIDYLENTLLDEKGYLRILPSAFYESINYHHLRLFCHKHSIYSLPTSELAKWLSDHFDLSDAIEIGAGNGSLAKFLGIPATDAKLSLRPEIMLLYSVMGQPLVKFGQNVIEMDAIESVKKYKPKTVIAQWVMHVFNPKEPIREGNVYGVEEQFILDNVTNYVFIGNEFIHKMKPILRIPHHRFQPKWVWSRAKYPAKNIIYHWGL